MNNWSTILNNARTSADIIAILRNVLAQLDSKSFTQIEELFQQTDLTAQQKIEQIENLLFNTQNLTHTKLTELDEILEAFGSGQAGQYNWFDLFITTIYGITQREFNEKVRYKNLKLQDYVTSAQNGDASLALLAAMNAAKIKGATSIDFEAYDYTFKTPITINALSNVTLEASDAILRDVNGLATVVEFTSATNVRIKLNSVIGIDDYTRHQTVGAAFQFFFKFTNAKNCQVYDAYVTNKRSLVQFYDCTNCKAFDNALTGFLPAVNQATAAEINANYLPLINISGGKFNKAYNNHADNHGSCVLWGRDSVAPLAWANTGTNLHDNGIYGSSGARSIAFANSFDGVRGTGVKQRGSLNLAILNTLNNCNVSVGHTGNGAADTFGANGFGNLIALNASSYSVSYAYNIGAQDGLLARDSMILFNTTMGHSGVGDFAPIQSSQVQGNFVAGNIIDAHTADMGILFGGSSGRDRNKSAFLALNSSCGSAPLARTLNGDYLIAVGNQNTGTGQGIQLRYQKKTLCIANSAAFAPAIVDSSSYPNEDLLIIANGGVGTNIASIATSIVEGNKTTSPSIDVTTIAPTRVNVLVRDLAGKPYISALQGSPATLQWKPLFDKPVTDSAMITLSSTSVAASGYTDTTVAATGAKFGDHVQLSYNQVPSNFDLFSFNAFVSSADTVTIRRRNVSGATATIGGCGAYVRVTARV
ncbi:hypothetical protein BKE30_03875 [Alkanindiges hydrocarboniclasticus]|uniref:Uncharacterized protein n=1 Tax=Alkanindiges hydrocarboniclasticus TaxID=1907941 RepID=A0A1S8CW66_9GAMM|nr:hypothetical protein [Alkanindiges hydrocarboniclasticus]ONG41578.1 hypothetical protein BKE30_03875 [Alkanindiges hydrocarboniclasticus]